VSTTEPPFCTKTLLPVLCPPTAIWPPTLSAPLFSV
jgi:hypothetical protein